MPMLGMQLDLRGCNNWLVVKQREVRRGAGRILDLLLECLFLMKLVVLCLLLCWLGLLEEELGRKLHRLWSKIGWSLHINVIVFYIL